MPPKLYVHRESRGASSFHPKSNGGGLPPEAGFLRHYGFAASRLDWAWAEARRLAVDVDEVLIASGMISAACYYLCLADWLGLPFAEASIFLAHASHPGKFIQRGYAPLAKSPGFRSTEGSLLAPRGQRIRLLLIAKSYGLPLPRLTITTPAHLSVLVRRVAARQIADEASLGLGIRDPELSARHAVDALRGRTGAGLCAAVLGLMAAAPHAILLALAPLFLAAIALRTLVCVLGFRASADPAPLPGAALPLYAIVVPLYREAGMVHSLIRHLSAIDYPAAKLEIKILVEPEDRETRRALEREALPPHFEIVTAPEGLPRTKPRALNVALPLLRAGLVTVYDAEDRPDPDQLRKAAAQFHDHPPGLACLQARLAISTDDGRLMSKLFAIEYAALFRLFNRGVAAAGLPFALGGTSNHFRVDILRQAGGWDAWNVAEDADLGFRLARFGYRVDMLASHTFEPAPPDWRNWFNQRRRWTKGWMQTFLVLARSPKRTVKDFGLRRTMALVLMGFSLVLGPLLSPLVAIALVTDAVTRNGLLGRDPSAIPAACLWLPILTIGTATILWTACAAIRQAGLTGCWRSLPLILPYQMLISAAAWGGLFDLLRTPYHWHKTDHEPLAGHAWPSSRRDRPETKQQTQVRPSRTHILSRR